MEKLITLIFSPIAFAIGFLTPLIAQVCLAMAWIDHPPIAYSLGFIIAIGFGLMAQFRGSWLWLKS
ncbi:MAG: hypothetical protein JJ934_01570 [Pseudomonadales bacterium]|nr:hypothetical protein [Pseudomonadales bacterium]MBO6565840.1 hypothetical protein [Pseudomonadales bacterium]MBO6594373.1 hypothetical protein [Pseudomonadales bacterium]MBO6655549.1 hypothetical protein [Pseudomonadales bacterium]MBO6700874.1 hypothetical protein [Pseudomonadales bacterium]